MRFNDSYVFCPLDRTLLLIDEDPDPLFECGPNARTLVFRSLSEVEVEQADAAPAEPYDPHSPSAAWSAAQTDAVPAETFDPHSPTAAWFAAGEEAEQELASTTPSRPLPELYARALEEEAERPSPLRHIPWAIGAGVAGIAVAVLALLG
jgi:hypothetical protein